MQQEEEDPMITHPAKTGPHIEKDRLYVIEQYNKILQPIQPLPVKVPRSPEQILLEHSDRLTEFEKTEILQYPEVYAFGQFANKKELTDDNSNQHTDDPNSLHVSPHDHIAYRYENLRDLGEGGYSTVFSAMDHLTDQRVAVKVLKRNTSLVYGEIKMLLYIRERDPDNASKCIHLLEFSKFRKHLYLVLELYATNLGNYLYCSKLADDATDQKKSTAKRIGKAILTGMRFLQEHEIIHGDLKPSNILLNGNDVDGLKIADFGLSVLSKHAHPKSIFQTIVYRAPEVFFLETATTAIDMWSFACMLGDIHFQFPFLKGEDGPDQIFLIQTMLGTPKVEFLRKCNGSRMFFNAQLQPVIRGWNPNEYFVDKNRDSQNRIIHKSPFSKYSTADLPLTLDNHFEHREDLRATLGPLMDQIMMYEPEKRITPAEALIHPFYQD